MEMLDRLVKLYELPPLEDYINVLREKGILVRRPRAYEKNQVLEWVQTNFSKGWMSECDVTFSNSPVSSFIATRDGEIIGFACYEATYRNFFGPIGVGEAYRGGQVGKALLLHCLHAMADMGYAYAIIGGPKEAAPFYARVVGAIDIEGSNPGIYIDRLRGKDS